MYSAFPTYIICLALWVNHLLFLLLLSKGNGLKVNPVVYNLFDGFLPLMLNIAAPNDGIYLGLNGENIFDCFLGFLPACFLPNDGRINVVGGGVLGGGVVVVICSGINPISIIGFVSG